MNSTKLFNINYLKQNLKKSKATLAFFLGIIPIFNIVIMLMAASNGLNTPDLTIISNINLLGIYIIPIVLSICLFGYMFKKKTVDFIGSMPLSRKTIFVTNTIGGIGLIILMNLINVVFLTLAGCFISELFIPITMIVDYFLFWTISYIFAFTATNIAMSVVGNAITGIAVTMLIVFLIPFISSYNYLKNDYINNNETLIKCEDNACIPEQYTCYDSDDVECLNNKNNHIYIPAQHNINQLNVNNQKYTTPYNIFYQLIFNDSEFNLYSTKEIVIMSILSIIYFIIGLELFKRRKMELSETSFQKMSTHLFVKNLTLIPILCLTYEVVSASDFDISIVFVFAVILVYYFIYDLITKKSINHIPKSLLSFAGTTIIIFAIIFVTDSFRKNIKPILKSNSIDSVTITTNLNNSINNGNTSLSKLKIEDKAIINETLKIISDTSDDHQDVEYFKFTYQVNNQTYSYSGYLGASKTANLITLLKKNKDTSEAYQSIDYDNIYAIKIGHNFYDPKDKQDILNEIKTALSQGNISTTNKWQEDYLAIELYSYKDHKLDSYEINPNISDKLLKMTIDEYNQALKQNITNDLQVQFRGSNIDVPNTNIYQYASRDLVTYILTHDNNIDLNKDYIIIEFYDYGNINTKSYRYITNNIEDINNIIEAKKTELQKNPNYDYLFDTDDEDTEEPPRNKDDDYE